MIRLGRALDDVSFVLGQATHFVQDLNQPLHGAWGETRAEHHEVEDQMLYRSWQKDHTNRGFRLVKDSSSGMCWARSGRGSSMAFRLPSRRSETDLWAALRNAAIDSTRHRL